MADKLNQYGNFASKKGAITWEHVDIMAMCCQSNSTFMIFAILVVWCRPCCL